MLLLSTLILSTQNSFFAQEARKTQCEEVTKFLVDDLDITSKSSISERKQILLQECLSGNKIPTVASMKKLLGDTNKVLQLVDKSEEDVGDKTDTTEAKLLIDIFKIICESAFEKLFGINNTFKNKINELSKETEKSHEYKRYEPEKKEWLEATTSKNKSEKLERLRRKRFINRLPSNVKERLETLLMREASK